MTQLSPEEIPFGAWPIYSGFQKYKKKYVNSHIHSHCEQVYLCRITQVTREVLVVVLWSSQRFEAARQRGDTAPSKGVIACLERLLTAAKRDASAAVVAGYERVLPAVLTSLAALDGSADASDDVIASALLEQVQQALATPSGMPEVTSRSALCCS